ncbi:hypothetical protein FAES_3937 [Fibrella aestuarina BUZ 2]|uniref:Phage portal protein, HK97 family n=1 Tax=Fibrella aestuarina BUZ 2 TaxID=1166018 RepID=I0KCU0_9BACT|nr:phage portal protein [Fibrella aestuarina]CCH01943.1 hypothetical protein FAES_3937 [Fibrella aestuarina BUZ 2]
MLSLLKRAFPTRGSTAIEAQVISDQSGFATSLPNSGLLSGRSWLTIAASDLRKTKKAYINPYIFIVANWKASRFSQATPLLYEVKNEKAYRLWTQRKGYDRLDDVEHRRKALEEIAFEDAGCEQLLTRPNPTQTWAELMYGHSIYHDFGNSLIRKITPGKGLNADKAKELWLLPTARWQGVTASLAGYEYYIDNQGQKLPAAEVCHIRRFNPMFNDDDTALWGLSKLVSSQQLVDRSNAALEAEYALMINQGKKTIIFPKSEKGVGLNPQEFANMTLAMETVRRKLKHTKTGDFANFNTELGLLEIGMSAADLGIGDTHGLTKEDLCALWGFNTLAVFSPMDNAKYSNLQEATKMSLRQGILPDLYLTYDKLSQFILGKRDLKKRKVILQPNTDVFPELQPDYKSIKEKADGMILTPNERREMFGWGRLDFEGMDTPMVPSGWIPLTDLVNPAQQQDALPDDEY